MTSRIVFVLITLLLVSSHGYAAISSVSGTITDGQTMSISGSSFGTHDLDYSQAIEHVNDATVGTTPADDGDWIYNSNDDDAPVVTSTYSHSGGQSLYHNMTATETGYNSTVRYDYGEYLALNQTVFVSWWTRMDYTVGGQWKMFRINHQNSIEDDGPQMTMFNWIDTGSKQFMNRPGPDKDSTGSDYYMSHSMTSNTETWYRHDLIIELSSAQGVYDGEYQMYRYDPDSSVVTSTETGQMTDNDSSENWRWFLWQNYGGNSFLGESWTDDHFVQVGTQARVELCDASTWAARTSCDIQMPATWSDTAITATVNTGAFSSSETAYIYVVADDGSVNSSGYSVTVNSGSATYTYCVDADSDDYYLADACGSYSLDPGGTYELMSSLTGEDCDDTDSTLTTTCTAAVSTVSRINGSFSGSFQ